MGATFILGLCLAIAAVEAIFAYRDVALGLALALLLVLVAYGVNSTLNFNQQIINSADSLTLLPLYILFTSSLPWLFLGQQYLLPAVYSVILGLCFWHIYQRNLNLKELLGFKKQWLLKGTLIGLFIAIPIGAVEYFILIPAPASPSFEFKYFLRDLVYMFLFVSLAEEVLFRGIIQRDLAEAFGWKWGLFGASAMFTIMHLTWRSAPELVFVFIIGMLLGYIYHRTKSLLIPIVVHGAGNTMLVAVSPYLFNAG